MLLQYFFQASNNVTVLVSALIVAFKYNLQFLAEYLRSYTSSHCDLTDVHWTLLFKEIVERCEKQEVLISKITSVSAMNCSRTFFELSNKPLDCMS